MSLMRQALSFYWQSATVLVQAIDACDTNLCRLWSNFGISILWYIAIQAFDNITIFPASWTNQVGGVCESSRKKLIAHETNKLQRLLSIAGMHIELMWFERSTSLPHGIEFMARQEDAIASSPNSLCHPSLHMETRKSQLKQTKSDDSWCVIVVMGCKYQSDNVCNCILYAEGAHKIIKVHFIVKWYIEIEIQH